MKRQSLLAIIAAAVLFFGGCSGGNSASDSAGQSDTPGLGDTGAIDTLPGDGGGDIPLDVASDLVADDADASSSDSADGSSGETSVITSPTYQLTTQFPVSPPADPLAFTDAPVSCALYQEERCEGGKTQRCEIYDVSGKQFVDTPAPLLKRVFLYGRWYDLYHSPDGQRMERLLHTQPDGDTPESQWGHVSNFKSWLDEGDSAIFTGGAVTAKIMRYLMTGTSADYQRMEDAVRKLLVFFEVTGIPGYLARYHFLYFTGTGTKPETDQHVYQNSDSYTIEHRDAVITNPQSVPDLPQDYLDKIAASNGELTATAMWHGNPSIDQYSGPWIALPLAYNLLKDETLKQRAVKHLTCYLKRLKRLEVINLKQNATVAQALTELLATGGYELKLDPGDPDLTSLDKVVIYYLPAYNPVSAADYDKSCPDQVALTPSRVIDAAAADWLAQGLELFEDLKSGTSARKNGIDHAYIVSIRGGDALHLMHMAAVAYQLTGEAQYKSFLLDELIGKLHADQIAKTFSALSTPDWCYSFYADHIGIPPLWSFLTFLQDSELKTAMQQVMETEAWQKRAFNQRNLKYNVLYAGETPLSIATQRDVALQQLLADLPNFGGNGKDTNGNVVLDSPRRNYTLDAQGVIDGLKIANIGLRGPTDEQRKLCEDGITVLGISLGGTKISYTCPQTLGEKDHLMGDGKCVRKLANTGIPPQLLRYEGFQWQRSTFELGLGGNGREQAPGIALVEPFWLARFYGFTDVGKNQVLAWKPTDTICTP